MEEYTIITITPIRKGVGDMTTLPVLQPLRDV